MPPTGFLNPPDSDRLKQQALALLGAPAQAPPPPPAPSNSPPASSPMPQVADPAPGWTLFGRVDNLFDKRYATSGALAENPFVGAGNAFASDPDEWRHEQFIAPGAPRAGWLGVRYAWDAL